MTRKILQFIGLLCLCATAAHAQGVFYGNIVLNTRGLPVGGATITVCGHPAVRLPCTNKVSIFADQNLASPLPNPTVSDGYGNVGFWIMGGPGVSYDITVTGQGVRPYTTTWSTPSASAMVRLQLLGTQLTSPDFALGTGWGTGAAISSITGSDSAFRFTVTAGTSPSIQPTVVLTFHDGPWSRIDGISTQMIGGTGATADISATLNVGLTQLTMTYDGLPVAGSTYTVTGVVTGLSNAAFVSPLVNNPVVQSPAGPQTVAGPNALNLQGPVAFTGNNTHSGTETFTDNLLMSAAGVFTSTQMNDYVSSLINNCNTATEFPRGNTSSATEAIVGCIAIPSNAANIIGSAIAGYANSSAGNANPVGPGLPIAIFGQTTCLVNNCWGWASNLIYEDPPTAGLTTGLWAHGLEIDMAQNQPASAYTGGGVGIAGLNVGIAGSGTGVVTGSYGVGIGSASGKQFYYGYFTQDASVSHSGIYLGTGSTPGNSASQTITFKGINTSTVFESFINGSSQGDLNLNPSSGRSVILFGNSFAIQEGSACNLSGGFDLLCADSTAHRLKMNNNGGTTDVVVGANTTDTFTNKSTSAGPLAGTVASSTAAMTTALIASGACGSTVTVAATGVLTTDIIEVSNNAAVTTPNGLLILQKWPTAGNVNFAYCNPTAAGVTPSAATLNWRVSR